MLKKEGFIVMGNPLAEIKRVQDQLAKYIVVTAVKAYTDNPASRASPKQSNVPSPKQSKKR